MTTQRGTATQWRVWSAIWLVGLIAPLDAPALGLGDAEVRSFLNQPLDVMIPLAVSGGDERQGLKVDLASVEDFRRVGLNRANLTVPITVELIDRPSGPVVHLTSSRPITDPFLQLLLDASWSSGRLLRQYTLFLDPPLAGEPTLAVKPEPAAPAAAPVAAAPPPQAARQAATSAPPPARERVAPAAAETPPGESYGPVVAGETLWSIAERHNPDRTAYSNNQVMLAFVRLNPEAFDDGNINRLHKGARLAVPDRQAIALLDAEQARRIASEQHDAWRAYTGRAAGRAIGDQGEGRGAGGASSPAGSGSSTAASRQDVQTQLKLVPPDANGEDGTLRDSATVRAELSRLEEELLTTRLENQDLARQVQELRDELEGRRGLEVVDPELAEFQSYLADAQQPEPPTTEGAEAGGDATAPLSAETTPIGNEPPAAETASPDAETAAGTPEPVAGGVSAPAPQPPATPPASADRKWVTGTMAVIAGIGLLAVVALIWLQKRRRGETAPQASLADRLVRAQAGARRPVQSQTQPRPKPAPRAAPPARQAASPPTPTPPPAPAQPSRVPPATTLAQGSQPQPDRRPASSEAAESPPLDETTRDLLQRLQAEDERLAGDGRTAGAGPAAEENAGLDFDRDAARELLRRGGESAAPKEEMATDPDPFESVLKLVKDDDEEAFEGAGGETAHGLPGGSDEDDIEIKLDLARAYISMGDADAARTIIDEVMEEGNEAQRAEGRNLLKQI